MPEFIEQTNIRLYEAKLAETTDPDERERIQRLLAEERTRPVTPVRTPGQSGRCEARSRLYRLAGPPQSLEGRQFKLCIESLDMPRILGYAAIAERFYLLQVRPIAQPERRFQPCP